MCASGTRVCAQRSGMNVYMQISSLVVFDFAFPVRPCALQTPRKSWTKFSIIIRCIAFDCRMHGAASKMKYSLNSQWFMMVSCKFDGTVCVSVCWKVAKHAVGIGIEWLFQFERNHLLQVNFSFRDLQSTCPRRGFVRIIDDDKDYNIDLQQVCRKSLLAGILAAYFVVRRRPLCAFSHVNDVCAVARATFTDHTTTHLQRTMGIE